jgi:hypothetical protein
VTFAAPRQQQRRAGWIAALVLLAALGPWLTVWHRVAHAVGQAAPAVAQPAGFGAAAATEFGHAAGSVECALFDATLCAEGPPAHIAPLAPGPLAMVAPSALAPRAPALAPAWHPPVRGPPLA